MAFGDQDLEQARVAPVLLIGLEPPRTHWSDILEAAGFERAVSDRAQRLLTYLLFGAVTSELATADAAEDPGTMTFTDDQEVFRFGLELLLDGLDRRCGAPG